MTSSLGQKIRELRIQRGLTQSDLGAGFVTPSMISQIEADKANPSHRLLTTLAERLEMPIEYFLTDMKVQMEQASLYKVAKALIENGDYAEALPILKELVNSSSMTYQTQELQFDLANCYRETGDLQKAGAIIEQLLESAMTRRDTHMTVQSLRELGMIEFQRLNYSLAVYHWSKALDLQADLAQADPFLLADILKNLAIVNSNLGDFKASVDFYKRAMVLLEGSQDIKMIGDIYLGLAQGYREEGNFVRASEYAQHAISLFRGLRHMRLMIETKEHYGVLKGEEGQIDEALQNLNECLQEYEERGYHERVAGVHGEIADIYVRVNDLKQARKHCELALAGELTDAQRGMIYRTLSHIDSLDGDLDAAVQNMKDSIVHYQKSDQPRELARSYSKLGDLYKEKGDLEQAVAALESMKEAMEHNLKERGIVL